MEILNSSPSWIIALGKTLLNSLWLGLGLISLLKLLYLLIPQRNAALRYHAAFLTLLVFSALTVGLFLMLYTPAGEFSSLTPGGFPGKEAGPHFTQGGMNDTPFYYYISISYIAGIVFYFIRTLTGLIKIRSIRQLARPSGSNWSDFLLEIKARAGIRRKVALLESEFINTPFLTGIIKPAIIVPGAMLSQLSLAEVESILMHELYHLKRLDNLMNLIQRLLEMVFFFNPAIWILSGMISSEREKRCDDLVLEGSSHPLDYARALYQLSEQQKNSVCLTPAATGKGKGELKDRIERILKPNTMKTNYRERINAFLIFICGLSAILLVSGFTSGLSITNFHESPRENSPESLQILQAETDTLSKEEKKQIQAEVEKALAEVDWDKIKEEMDELRQNIEVDIDWDELKLEVDEATQDVLADIDWDQIKIDMDGISQNIEVDIDWEEIRKEIDEATQDVLTDIDWDQLKIDMEELRQNIEVDIDWDQIKIDLEEARLMMKNMDLEEENSEDVEREPENDGM